MPRGAGPKTTGSSLTNTTAATIKTGTELIAAARAADPAKFARIAKRHAKKFSGRVAELSAASEMLPAAAAALTFESLHQ